MNKLVTLFNELIRLKLSPAFGNSLLNCKLIERGYDYRLDLAFVFRGEYNNPSIQLENVLEVSDMLFEWVDLRDIVNLSIVIITEFGRTRHFSYFELMDELYRSNSYSCHRMHIHPKYRQYMEWKSNREREERMKRAWEMEMGKATIDKTQQSRIAESRKKKFLFW